MRVRAVAEHAQLLLGPERQQPFTQASFQGRGLRRRNELKGHVRIFSVARLQRVGTDFFVKLSRYEV